ncbi:hypothetical protein PVL29_011809 [Vitis rotundifolia]|uniref:Retrotransposon Copia-like N-terminal domain-containing protein n=1 Tax=Vitis rotundifolia TaxID=103349 RepID=A0AA38ZQ41_VITRO|nr:hypothetical protein PVL29_011809 [Vitis rotundifolia]
MDENFLIWKQQALTMIQAFGLEGFIYNTSICPFEMTSSVWKSARQDQLLVFWLLSSMSESILQQMVGCNTISDIWRTFDKLEEIRLDNERRSSQNENIF